MASIQKKNIGLLGGSFDPAHKGHLGISRIAIKKLKLKKVYWVITKKNPFKNEKRILCQSPPVATYDLKPEMSAIEVRDAVIKSILKNEFDFICVNFANPDMVGHTGDFNAAIKACETVDHCTYKIISKGLKNEYSIVIIADHGNCEKMKNSDGTPNTAHTTNPVPIILVEKEKRKITSID